MASNFVNTSYESDAGFVCLLRMSKEESLATTLSTAAVTEPFHCLNSGSVKKFGVHPRGVVLTRKVGTPPNEFNKGSFLVYPTPAGYAAVAVGSKITVGTTEWTVSKKRPESLS